MSPLDATNASFIMDFIVLVSSRWDTTSQYGKGRKIFVTCLRYSANHNALDSWPIRACLTSQNDELCKNRRVSEKHRGATIQYVENIYIFFYFKPYKHIALHQIHKIMFFLATSYDLFNYAQLNKTGWMLIKILICKIKLHRRKPDLEPVPYSLRIGILL